MSNFSKTAIKQFRRMTKDQMIKALLDVSNYAENQKAMSTILLTRVRELEKELTPEQIEKVNKVMTGDNSEQQTQEQA